MNCNDCKKYENKCQPPDCFHFEPNENKMEFFNGSSNYIKTYDHMLSEKEREDEYNKMEKVQMTEEQADQIYDAFLYKASNEIGRQQFKNALKSNGFIKKSELQTLVDECLEMRKIPYGKLFNIKSIDKLLDCIEALKKSHPEFKK